MVESTLLLKHGSIHAMVNNDISFKPNLQVLDFKKIVTSQFDEQVRLVLSDGQSYIQGMLAIQCASLVNNGQFKKFTIINVKKFVCDRISGKAICIIIEYDVVKQMNKGIGRPSRFEKENKNGVNKILMDLKNEIKIFSEKYNEQKLQEIYNKSPKELIQKQSNTNININQCKADMENILLLSKSFVKYIDHIDSCMKKISTSNTNNYKMWNLDEIIKWIVILAV